VLAYSYDSLGRKTGLFKDSTSGPKLADWTYDGITGARGMLTSSSRYVDGDLTNPYTNAILTVDTAKGLPTKTAVTIPATEKGLAGTYTYQARYAADGSPATSIVPAIGPTGDLPSETLTTNFNDIGLPTTLSTTLGGGYVSSAQLTEFGEPSLTFFANAGSKSLQIANDYYPDTRRLQSTQVYREVDPAVVSWKTYKYDDAGDIIRTGEQSAISGVETQCWRLDYLQQLTDAWTPKDGNCDVDPSVDNLADSSSSPAPYWTSWTFNAAGDRTKQVEHKTAVGVPTTDYTYPAPTAAHPHVVTGTTITGSAGTSATAQYRYDELGNITQRPTAGNGQQTLTWDIEGHLASATDNGGTTSYVYDADGNRLISNNPTGKTLYLPGQELRVANDGAVQSCTRYYAYGGKTIAQRTAAGLTWLVATRRTPPRSASTRPPSRPPSAASTRTAKTVPARRHGSTTRASSARRSTRPVSLMSTLASTTRRWAASSRSTR
jgi:YD repeat-containing protein